uniref:(northern house mosquito) hypothetical protein n=1 Tax=Culex pipiens TaxID=7175 RepID=A0A8D8P1Z8_CULPI
MTPRVTTTCCNPRRLLPAARTLVTTGSPWAVAAVLPTATKPILQTQFSGTSCKVGQPVRPVLGRVLPDATATPTVQPKLPAPTTTSADVLGSARRSVELPDGGRVPSGRSGRSQSGPAGNCHDQSRRGQLRAPDAVVRGATEGLPDSAGAHVQHVPL